MKKNIRLNVHLYVIPTCNLKCIHCYYDAKDTKFKINKMLTINEMRSIIIFLIDNYDTYFDIEGGELFLRQDIVDLFSSLEDKYLNRLTITTNGTTKFDYSHQYLKQLDEVRVSFEGHTDDLQNDIRGITLEKPLKTTLKLLENNAPVVVRLTIHKKNHLFIREIVDFFHKKGVSNFSMYEYQLSGRGIEYEEYCLNKPEIIRVIKALNSIDSNCSFKFSLPCSRASLVKQYSNHKVLDISGSSSLTINYDGGIGVCPWEITIDKKMYYDPNDFEVFINDAMQKRLFDHSCDYCSSIRITNEI